MTQFRYDYQKDGRTVVVHVPEGRSACMMQAARASKVHGSAYAIRNENGKDTGQRVYDDGRFSYQEDEF